MKIQQYAQQDPNSFYTERWADGYMVYHGRSYCFSYSITRAKNRLIELREYTKGLIPIEYFTEIERSSQIVTRKETYGSLYQNRGIVFTNIYPAQNDPHLFALFALKKHRWVFTNYEQRLQYEAQFDIDIYVDR